MFDHSYCQHIHSQSQKLYLLQGEQLYLQIYLQLSEGELNLRNHDATASHLYIALSKHLMHQNCHQGAQNQHKQLASCSYEMVQRW